MIKNINNENLSCDFLATSPHFYCTPTSCCSSDSSSILPEATSRPSNWPQCGSESGISMPRSQPLTSHFFVFSCLALVNPGKKLSLRCPCQKKAGLWSWSIFCSSQIWSYPARSSASWQPQAFCFSWADWTEMMMAWPIWVKPWEHYLCYFLFHKNDVVCFSLETEQDQHF